MKQDLPPNQYAFAELPVAPYKLGKRELAVLHNELALQHQLSIRQFLCFTPETGLYMNEKSNRSTGLIVFAKARPLDDLIGIFQRTGAESAEANV